MYAVMTLISRVAQFSKPVQIKSDIISMFLRSDKKKQYCKYCVANEKEGAEFFLGNCPLLD